MVLDTLILLCGWKLTLFEGGIKVPLIFWKDASKEVAQRAMHIDIMPQSMG